MEYHAEVIAIDVIEDGKKNFNGAFLNFQVYYPVDFVEFME